MAVCLLLTRQGAFSLGLLLPRTVASASVLKLSSALTTGCSNRRGSRRDFCYVRPAISAPFATGLLQVRCLTTKKETPEKPEKQPDFAAVPDPGHLQHFNQASQKGVAAKDTTTTARTTSFEGVQDGQCAQSMPGKPSSVEGVQNGQSMDTIREGTQQDMPDPGHIEHFKDRLQKEDTGGGSSETHMGAHSLPHPIWSDEQLHNVKVTHRPPVGFVDRFALFSVKLLRTGFDVFSGFNRGHRNEQNWITRIIFLETVAGVPGMVAAMMRHMISLRRMQRDFGWIHTLLEEAENERMHLMTALQLKQPSLMFRTAVVGSQGVFVTLFVMWYIVSPRFCHRFVGYLEEEAVITYTKCLEDIANGPLQHWKTQTAPDVAIRYWKLPEDASMRDVILAIRADEAHHRVVNHNLASMKTDQFNPYKPGQ